MKYPGYTVYDGQSNIETSWFDQLWIPNRSRGASKYGVILLHGASTLASTIGSQWTLDGWHHLSKLAAVLANAGIPCIAGHMGGNNFSNDACCGTASTAYMNKALTYMAAQTGCSSAKAHVFGVSMGGGNGPRWAGLNPSKAASVTGIIPNVSIQHLYTDNPNNTVGAATQGFSEMIAAAWGLTSRVFSDAVLSSNTTLQSATGAFTTADNNRQVVGDNLTAGQKGIQPNTIATFVNSTTITLSKPALTTASGQKIFIGDPLPMSGASGADIMGYFAPILASNGIPVRAYYASDDPYIYPADVTAFATAAGGTAINLGTGGHADATAANMDVYNGTDFSDYVQFLIANGA